MVPLSKKGSRLPLLIRCVLWRSLPDCNGPRHGSRRRRSGHCCARSSLPRRAELRSHVPHLQR
jgi:hypothetical protein